MDTGTEKPRDRVVVGVDGSDASIAALRYGARLADAFGVSLEAVYAWMYPRYADPVLDLNWTTDPAAIDALGLAVRQAFGDEPPNGLTQTVLEGRAAETLIALSDSCGMLVVGSRGRGGFTGLLLGSVSRACVAYAHCPVLVVHEGKSPVTQSTAR